jgi:hypothetical protein
MKRTIAIALIFIVIAACTRQGSSAYHLSVVGKWELREVIGGIANLKYSAGNGNAIHFNTDFSFLLISHSAAGIDTVTGKYQITKFLSNNQGIVRLQSDSAKYVDATDSVKIEDNKLILSVPYQCCDMPYMTTYEKLP